MHCEFWRSLTHLLLTALIARPFHTRLALLLLFSVVVVIVNVTAWATANAGHATSLTLNTIAVSMAMTMTRADRAGRTHGGSPTGHHGRTVHKDEVPRSRGVGETM